MQQQLLRRITGLSGIFALGMVVFTYLLFLLAGVNIHTLMQHFPDVVFPGFSQQPGRPGIFGLWTLIISNFFLIGFGTGLERLYANRHWSVPFATRILVSSMLISIIVTLFSIGIQKGLAPVVLEAGEFTDTLRGTARSFVAFRNYAAIFAGILVALASIGFGLAVRDNSEWLGYWGIAAGSIGITGAFWPLFEWLSYLRNLGGLLFLFWVCYVGILILREESKTGTGFNPSIHG